MNLRPPLLALAMIVPALSSPGPRPATAASLAPAVTVSVAQGPEGLEVEGRCRLRAMPAAAWAVLTDYEGIPEFVSSMRESRVTERGSDYVLVEQAAIARFFLFSRRLKTVLRVQEEPPGRIRFEDVLGRDFSTYRGSWRIEGDPESDELEIVYELTAKPAFGVPDGLARGAFKRAVRQLIGEVGAEIERRAKQAGLAGLDGG
jgi:ribosome-associated toxin RatA of RatAB toxin-antitoxin module